MEFRWIDWNIDKVHSHGVEPEEAEEAVGNARPPYPRKDLDGRWLVQAQSDGGRFLQVVYLVDPEGTLFIIHSRPLTEREKKKLRRRRS
jgi:uncharacterized DUF497 family protein